MNDDQDVQDQLPDAEGVGAACAGFRPFEELKQAWESQEPVESKERGVTHADCEVQEVRWEDGADIKFTLECSDVGFSQTTHIFHQQALIQEPLTQEIVLMVLGFIKKTED